MQEWLLILIGTVLVNNIVLTRFLGLCPLFGASNELDTAIGMGLATALVLTLTATVSYLVETYVLVPFGLEFLRTLVFIVVIAASVQGLEILMRNASPILHRMLGLYLPLITSNCAVLGVALLVSRDHQSVVAAATYGLGAAIGFTLVLVLFASLRERLAAAPVPAPFAGAGIALVTAGIMALAFMGFAGLDR